LIFIIYIEVFPKNFQQLGDGTCKVRRRGRRGRRGRGKRRERKRREEGRRNQKMRGGGEEREGREKRGGRRGREDGGEGRGCRRGKRGRRKGRPYQHRHPQYLFRKSQPRQNYLPDLEIKSRSPQILPNL
jgi:hypothetical protein